MCSIAIEEGNKLQNLCDVLIVVIKRNKFGNENATVWLFLSYYMGVNSFLLLYSIYLCVSLETSMPWLGSFPNFIQILISGGGRFAIRISWYVFKKDGC